MVPLTHSVSFEEVCCCLKEAISLSINFDQEQKASCASNSRGNAGCCLCPKMFVRIWAFTKDSIIYLLSSHLSSGCPLQKVVYGWLCPSNIWAPEYADFHSAFLCCSLGHFSIFSRLFCCLFFPSKNVTFLLFHTFWDFISTIFIWLLCCERKCLNSIGWPTCIHSFILQ